MAYKNYNWYIRQGLKPPAGVKPKETGYERKTWSWYTRQGLTPPDHLKPPKAIREGATNVMRVPAFTPQVVMPLTALAPLPDASPETDAEIAERIATRFGVLAALVQDVVEGDVRGLIVSGPPGLGKSFTVEQGLDEVECRIVKGHARATGLFKLLYEYKDEGQILVFDDCDSIFEDHIALNLLKTALDTTEERVVSWMTEAGFLDAEDIPETFTYEGSIIFITNLDFDRMIQRGSKIGKHLEALISRSHYIDLGLKSVRDYVIRIKQVISETNMLGNLTKHQQSEVIEFIESNKDTLREISLWTALKVGTLVGSGKPNWKAIATITMCKN